MDDGDVTKAQMIFYCLMQSSHTPTEHQARRTGMGHAGHVLLDLLLLESLESSGDGLRGSALCERRRKEGMMEKEVKRDEDKRTNLDTEVSDFLSFLQIDEGRHRLDPVLLGEGLWEDGERRR